MRSIFSIAFFCIPALALAQDEMRRPPSTPICQSLKSVYSYPDLDATFLGKIKSLGFRDVATSKWVCQQEPKAITGYLQSYFKARGEAGADAALADFTWSYFVRNEQLKTIRVKSESPIAILGTISTKGEHRYQRAIPVKGETLVVVPITNNQVTLLLESENGRVSKTHLTGVNFDLAFDIGVRNSKAIKVVVESLPDKADLFFNDVKYHNPTNTNSVREPGKVTVRISKAGYKDWSDTRELEQGNDWEIKAILMKEGSDEENEASK